MRQNRIISKTDDLSVKMILVLLFIGLLLIVVNTTISHTIITKYFEKIEDENIIKKVDQASKIIQNKALDVEQIARDYSIWDDTYEAVATNNKAWLKENFSDWLPFNSGIDLIVVMNQNEKILEYYGEEDESFFYALEDKAIVKGLTENIYDKNKKIYGLKKINEKLYIIGASPIHKSTMQVPSDGMVILGKKVTSDLLNNIKNLSGCNIFFTFDNKYISEKNIKEKIEANYVEIINNEKVFRPNKFEITANLPIYDLSDKNIAKINVFEQTSMYHETLKLINKNTFFTSCLLTILLLLSWFIIKKIIINPVKEFERQINKMSKEALLTHVDMNGPKEIKSLAISFNKMTDHILKHKKTNENLKLLSNTDELTGLYNHRYFYEYFNDLKNNKCKNINLLFCDIDKFKSINDNYGHKVGDSLLKELSRTFKEIINNTGNIFRYGGEEFVILLCNCNENEAYNIAEKVRIGILNNKIIQKYSDYLPITISVGISNYPKDGEKPTEIIEKADMAMYFSKQNGRNQSNIYDESMKMILKQSNDEFMQKEMLLDSVLALAEAIDAKDNYTGNHSKVVARFSLLLAEKLSLDEKQKYFIRIGALLHDCGKIGIPDYIIRKPTSLSNQEFDIIKNHTILGHNIIKHIVKEEEIVSCVRNHHERWDGKGYPDELSGNSVHLNARIVSIADAYHAMRSDRSYRKALTKNETIEEIIKNKGKQFDPILADLFIEVIREEK